MAYNLTSKHLITIRESQAITTDGPIVVNNYIIWTELTLNNKTINNPPLKNIYIYDKVSNEIQVIAENEYIWRIKSSNTMIAWQPLDKYYNIKNEINLYFFNNNTYVNYFGGNNNIVGNFFISDNFVAFTEYSYKKNSTVLEWRDIWYINLSSNNENIFESSMIPIINDSSIKWLGLVDNHLYFSFSNNISIINLSSNDHKITDAHEYYHQPENRYNIDFPYLWTPITFNNLKSIAIVNLINGEEYYFNNITLSTNESSDWEISFSDGKIAYLAH